VKPQAKLSTVLAGSEGDWCVSPAQRFPAATDLAYVIYTSGTTGRPKGNLISHRNVIRVVKDANYLDIFPHDRLLQLSNYAFDGSVFDIYGALLNGAALIIPNPAESGAVTALSALIQREAISLFFVTTALFNVLVDLALPSLAWVRKILFGGERVSVEHTRKALAFLGKGRLMHVYGPTESTVYATYYDIDDLPDNANTVPIGRPVTNTGIYVLNRLGNLVPIGVMGEIYIGGQGLSRGYLNNPELTQEKFRPSPPCPPLPFEGEGGVLSGLAFPSPHGGRGVAPISGRGAGVRGDRLYRTGDLGRWLDDGNIEFLGRIDQQVKIRGFRIEPGEIEAQLLKHPAIQEALVVCRDQGAAEKFLCAYFVPHDPGREMKTREWREFLS
jgi:amino acid adenylation domain-containing protein